MTLFTHPPSLSAFLIVTCHFLSLPLPPCSHFRQGDEHHTVRRSIERGGNRALRTEEEKKKSQTGCLFSMSFKELSHQRCKTVFLLHSPLASHQFTRSHIHPLSHVLRHTSRLLFPPILISPLFEWVCLSSSLLNHIFCRALPLHEEPVELISLPLFLLCLSPSLCLRLSAITLSSLRWPVIVCSPG